MKTVNPFKHPYPHAKLYNHTLSSVKRLSKFRSLSAWQSYSSHMIANDDPRNFSITYAPKFIGQK